MALTWKHIQPLTAVLDKRSAPDQIQVGSWRKRLNFTSPEKGKLLRAHGWKPFGWISDATYNNADLHDQLLAIDGAGEREPIQFLKAFASSTGVKVLIAGTNSRIYKYNGYSKNWQLLKTGLGGGSSTATHWSCAQLLDHIILTNNYDPVQHWTIGYGPRSDDDNDSISEIDDLSGDDGIDLTRAAVVCSWRGFIFLGDVVMDGARYEYRIVWSDHERALAWDPEAADSVTGWHNLPYGERVIAMKELGDYLLIYTNKGIWQVTVAGSTASDMFNFRKMYSDADNSGGCLYYPNTLITVGDSHFYAGRDDIYAFGLSSSKPETPEWIAPATKTMFDNINSARCQSQWACYFDSKKQAIFSYASTGSEEPDATLCLDFESSTVHEMDHGFLAGCAFIPGDQMTFRDFMLQNCICTLSEMISSGVQYIREGMPLANTATGISYECATPPTCFVTTARKHIEGDVDVWVEDYDQADNPTAQSLCSLMVANGYTRIEDLCSTCDQDPVDLLVSAEDYCIKAYNEHWSRARCVNPVDSGNNFRPGVQTAIAQFVLDGYISELITGPIKLPKTLRSIEVEFEEVDVPSVSHEIVLTVGVSSQATDPENPIYPIVWREQVINRRFLTNQSVMTAAQMTAANIRPNRTLNWPLQVNGEYVYLKFTVKNAGGEITEGPTDGCVMLSRISLGF